MFLAEGFMKRNLDGYLAKATFLPKKLLPVVKGVIFLSASLTGSSIGRKIGKQIAEVWDVPLDAEIRMQRAYLERENELKKQEALEIKA